MFIRKFCVPIALSCMLSSVVVAKPAPKLTLVPIGTYQTGLFDQGASEIIAHDPVRQRLFVINAAAVQVDVLDISQPNAPIKIGVLDASALGGGVNSVAVHGNKVAVAIQAENKQEVGTLAVFRASNLALLKTFDVGALPDMVTFSPNGRFILVANEGEPNDEYTVDPEGSISIVDLKKGLRAAVVKTANFKAFIGQEAAMRERGIRIFGPNANAAQDLEPEYITIDKHSATAWVSLQEANAIAVVDIGSATVKEIWPLGSKDHSVLGNELDASNKDEGVAIQTWPVQGMYMPDTIAGYDYRGQHYIVTANEGDSRDYAGYSEEVRIRDLLLDPVAFPDADELQKDENLGRLKSTTANGDTDGDDDIDVLYSYGARSFSIRNQQGELVFDSGAEFERIIAQRLPEEFNSNNDENDSMDSRSDDKGPEPEALAIGKLHGRTYAFIGLERMGGVMIYDITVPSKATFVNYMNNRNFSVAAQLDDGSANPTVGDLGVESLVFISACHSPNGKPLLIAGNEVSGTTTVFQIQQE